MLEAARRARTFGSVDLAALGLTLDPAKILTAGLLGEQYIGLEPGYGETNLAAGDAIKSTQSAVVLENLISQFLYNKAAEPNNGQSK